MGVAFLLVTFLWPRKEKSLAQPRSGGETPSRTESSCPAWRSHANTLLQGRDVTQPLTLTLSHRGRGDRSPVQCASLIGTLPVSRKGEGMVTADDYAALIDPTGLLHPEPHPVVGEVHSRCLVRHPLEC